MNFLHSHGIGTARRCGYSRRMAARTRIIADFSMPSFIAISAGSLGTDATISRAALTAANPEVTPALIW